MSVFSLSALLVYDNFAIQCHNYPDADTIASAFALYSYLTGKGKTAQIIYSGAAKISKPNLLLMKSKMEIPISHVESLPAVEALILADCQYGEGNTKKFAAQHIFQFDHHEEKKNGISGMVQSSLGSCSTLIWSLLKAENFDFKAHPNVCNALYYGLFTDTCSLEEVSHPLDKDMRDSLNFDTRTIDLLRFNNLTIDELTIAGNALACNRVNHRFNYAIFKASACDQNVLGFIADLALQVENVGVCIVYNTLPSGFRLSVRSCTREVLANEFVEHMANGGGHRNKAGGFIAADKVCNLGIDAYIERLTTEYFESFDLIYADNHDLPVSSMPLYVKKKIPLGFVPTTDIFAAGTPLLIRTLEGDSDVYASNDTYLMIGAAGEVYPIKRERFEQTYTQTHEASQGKINTTAFVYSPTVRDRLTGSSGDAVLLSRHAKACIPTGISEIHALPLTKKAKVFNAWNPHGYMAGKPGDFLAVRADNTADVYIIARDVFFETYENA
jgi:phosphoglycolate phosphatase